MDIPRKRILGTKRKSTLTHSSFPLHSTLVGNKFNHSKLSPVPSSIPRVPVAYCVPSQAKSHVLLPLLLCHGNSAIFPGRRSRVQSHQTRLLYPSFLFLHADVIYKIIQWTNWSGKSITARTGGGRNEDRVEKVEKGEREKRKMGRKATQGSTLSFKNLIPPLYYAGLRLLLPPLRSPLSSPRY